MIFFKDLKWASKNIYKTCATWACGTCFIYVFLKSQNFGFFQKRGLRGSKNEIYEKIFPKSKRASKIGYITCATLPKRTKKIKNVFFYG